MITISKRNEFVEIDKDDESKVNSFVPFPDESIDIKGNIDFGEFFRIIVNSKELDKYHKYYGYPLKDKSLYAKCREWSDPINTRNSTVDWLVIYWKVSRSDDFVDFNPRFVGVELDGSKKVIEEVDNYELIEFEFTPFHLDPMVTINNTQFKKRFTVYEIISTVFKKL